jgi:hypothetical protein
MIAHTRAYSRFLSQGKNLYDFCVLVSYAIPSLSKQLAGLVGGTKGQIPPSRYIKNENVTAEELKRRIGSAGAMIGKELVLSTFSYFEAYAVDVLKETLDFHDGAGRLQDLSASAVLGSDSMSEGDLLKSKRKVQEYPKRGKSQSYLKHARILFGAGFTFPSGRLASYGWKKLSEEIKSLKSVRILDVLQTALLCPITKTEVEKFHRIRDKRNKIAHGQLNQFPVKTSLDYGKFLRDLAVKIDRHVVEHFLVIEFPHSQL